MYQILKRSTKDNTVGRWFPIWRSKDGTDTANYLRQCVEVEESLSRPGAEYKMIYTKDGAA